MTRPTTINPFKKAHVMGRSTAAMRWCGTYDIGRVAAVMFANKNAWLWDGSIYDFAIAVEKVMKMFSSVQLHQMDFLPVSVQVSLFRGRISLSNR